jgi:protein MAK11
MAEQHSTVSSDVLPLLRIAVTSYEGSLFGWNVFENASNSGLESKMVFGFNCCQSSLRALAVSPSGRYIACGGMDERIRLYDMTTNRSIGEISNQSGAINCLRFFGDSYLLNGSEDNTVGVWRTNDWLCVHTLGGHKAPINDLSIHPSGKLALSVSKDNTMKMWNLVHGRCSFTRRLKGSADKVHWNDTGDSYLLVINTVLHVYLAADNSCVINTDLKSRVNEAVFTSIAPDGDGSTDASASARIACICENKILTLFDMKGTKTASLDLSTVGGRLRDMKSVVLPPTERLSPQCLSEGPVKQALEGEGGLLTVVTSVGKVIVLSCRELEAGGSLEEVRCVRDMHTFIFPNVFPPLERLNDVCIM